MDLTQVLAELKDRRWKTAHWLGSAYNDDRLAELVRIDGAIRAVEAVIAEGRPAPDVHALILVGLM